MKNFIVIDEMWNVLFSTKSKKVIDSYIKEHNNIFQVLYRKDSNSPYHVYFS